MNVFSMVNVYTTCMPAAHRSQEKELDLLELELKMIVSWHMDADIWMLTYEPGSSARAASVLKCWCISPAPAIFFFF